MSGMSYNSRTAALLFFTILYFSGIEPAGASLDIAETAKNFNNRKKQTMLQGTIDTLVIKRDNVEIYLGSGDVTLYDFGAEKHSMMFYSGPGRFVYTPPDDSEKKYLRVLTGLEKIDGLFKDASFIMAIDDTAPIDTSLFKREKIKERDWREVTRFNDELADYIGINTHIRVFGDILSGKPVSCFLAKFKIEEIGDLVYIEDPLGDDFCRIYRYTDKDEAPDILAGYSSGDLSAEQRGYIAVDIAHYDIKAKVDKMGEIESNCGIRFNLLREDFNFVYFNLSKDLRISSVTDSSGEALPFFSWEDSPGFGVWIDRPIQIEQEYQINVEYEGKPFIYEWEIYFTDKRNPWYPKNSMADRSLFDIKIDFPPNYSLAHGGEPVEQFSAFLDNFKYLRSKGEAEWSHQNEISDVTFCVGKMSSFLARPKEQYYLHMYVPGLQDWGIKIPEAIITNYWTTISITMTDIEWFEESANEAARILILLDRILDCEPSLVTSVIEYPFNNGMGSPGLICLSSYVEESVRHRIRFTRAHETAHQWWGSIVGFDDYHDMWIIEGLAEYMAFMTDYDPLEPIDKPDSILAAWRDSIVAAGADRFPMTMGDRLGNPAIDRYDDLIITKSAYIFHMIRYMLYDFNQNSDRLFLTFLRDIVETYKWRSIDVQGLNAMLDKHIGMEMDWFFRQWVNGTEIPQYHVSFDFPEIADSTYDVILRVKQQNVPPDFKMIIPVKVDMADDYFVVYKLMIDEPDKEIKLSKLPYKPIDLKFNLENAVLCREASQGE